MAYCLKQGCIQSWTELETVVVAAPGSYRVNGECTQMNLQFWIVKIALEPNWNLLD